MRTPIGSFRSLLCKVTAPRLGAIAVKAAIEKAGIVSCVVYYEFVVNLLRTSFPSTFFVPWTVISTMLCLYFVVMKKIINNFKFWGWCKDFCKKGSNNIVNSDTDFIMSPSDNKAVKSPSSVLAFSSYIYITKIPYYDTSKSKTHQADSSIWWPNVFFPSDTWMAFSLQQNNIPEIFLVHVYMVLWVS